MKITDLKTTVTAIGTAFSAAGTTLAVAPYDLGSIATVIPPEYKPAATLIGIILTILLNVLNGYFAKDAK